MNAPINISQTVLKTTIHETRFGTKETTVENIIYNPTRS